MRMIGTLNSFSTIARNGIHRQGFTFFLAIILLHGLMGKLVGYFVPLYLNELGFSGIKIDGGHGERGWWPMRFFSEVYYPILTV